ncbi:hypothetical protein ACFSL4_04830 [Streptomyces caeni]|uniref:Uncharacterized protein n=1 Tax=Streptomyces caeni TaxID=2307231 RepID=A0ABW4IJS8_9ACTN
MPSSREVTLGSKAKSSGSTSSRLSTRFDRSARRAAWRMIRRQEGLDDL